VGVHAGAAGTSVLYQCSDQHVVGGSCARIFFLYAALVGISLSTILHIYTQSSITRVFFISAAAFGALSIWGYTTQRNLSGFGTFFFMGLIGVIIASLVNLFLRSSGLDWIISIIGVGVFAGLTAYDTQRIKGMYDLNDDSTSAGRKAVTGALSLYLNFINLFMILLRLAGAVASAAFKSGLDRGLIVRISSWLFCTAVRADGRHRGGGFHERTAQHAGNQRRPICIHGPSAVA